MEKDTQTKLLEAATQLFSQKGFNAVSTRELAEAAGANIAAISYYFRGKEGLYQAVLEEQFAPISQALKTVEARSDIPPAERLTLYARHIASIHRQRPHFIRFMHGELVNPTPCLESVIKKYISRIYQFLHKALQDGVDAGDFKPDLNLGFAVVSLAGIMNFYFFARPIFREFMPLTAESDQEYTAQAFGLYLDGIRRRDDE
ncbi:MAG: CerR family C-terminal domain-containing protein [Negativicutes bacterium]|nr:CerR family C-terminal domain-containing protein [Negativicutes bacterium]